MTTSGTNLLGLVKHLAGIEAEYFGGCLGHPGPCRRPRGTSLPNPTPTCGPRPMSPPSRSSNCTGGLRPGPTRPSPICPSTPRRTCPGGNHRTPTLHRLLVHMIAETARHAGHMDILRETIDGQRVLLQDISNMPDVDEAWWQQIHGAGFDASAESSEATLGDRPKGVGAGMPQEPAKERVLSERAEGQEHAEPFARSRIPSCCNEIELIHTRCLLVSLRLKGGLRSRGQDSPTLPGGVYFSGRAPSRSCTSWPMAATTWSVMVADSHIRSWSVSGGSLMTALSSTPARTAASTATQNRSTMIGSLPRPCPRHVGLRCDHDSGGWAAIRCDAAPDARSTRRRSRRRGSVRLGSTACENGITPAVVSESPPNSRGQDRVEVCAWSAGRVHGRARRG